MGAEDIYRQLKQLALINFFDIVEDAYIVPGPLNFPRCLRVLFVDGSFMEIRISEEKYSFHYDRRMVDGRIFRLDNAPHHKEVKTYPHHFHNAGEEAVEENTFGYSPEERFVHFIEFIKNLNTSKKDRQKISEKK